MQAIATRQQARRADARDDAQRRSRTALVTIVLGAGLALAGVLAFLTLLIRTMRHPLDDLVVATRRMSSGDLTTRVDASGPQELQALGVAFNTMGADLETASRRVETQRQRLATTIQSLGDGLLICDNGDRITSMNPRASELVPGLRIGSSAHGFGSPLPRPATRWRARSRWRARATSRSRSPPRASPAPTAAPSGRCATSPSAHVWSRPRATSWRPRRTSCAAR